MSIEKVPFFCPNIHMVKNEKGELIEEKCAHLMRPLDIKCWEKVGCCLECLGDLESHIKATGAPELNEEYKRKILEAFNEMRVENEGKGFQTYG